MIKDVSELKHLVAFEKPQYASGPYGSQQKKVYKPYKKLLCHVRDFSSREFFEGGAKMVEQMIVVTLRTRSDLTQDMRLTFKGQAFEIVQMPTSGNPKTPRFMEIRAQAVKGEGNVG